MTARDQAGVAGAWIQARPALGQAMPPAMGLALDASFGSAERWREQAVALAQRNPAGCLLLVFRPSLGCLLNQWSASAQPECTDDLPILVLHRAHAAQLEPGLASIDWARVHSSYQQAIDWCSEALAAGAEAVPGARLLDVRRAAVFEQADAVIPGACWHDPQQVADWAATIPSGDPVLVYCVMGHEVSRAVALRLRAAGMAARFLTGGIEGWRSAGGPLAPKAALP